VIIDAIGQSHPICPDARILSLVPSLSELLCDLGLSSNLVGRTVFCIHPKDKVKNVPTIGGTKQVNMDKVKALGATHLIVNIDENPKDMVEELSKLIPNVIVTHPNAPDDNIGLYQLFGHIFDRNEAATRLITDFHAAKTHAQMTAMDLPEKKVLYFIWKDPWMSIASETYIAHSLKVANLISYPLESDRRYPEVDFKSGILDEVDAILFSSEPFLFKPHHLEAFAEQNGVSKDKLHIIDGEMTSWYGSRAIQGLRYLSEFAKNL
jgi:ABC-type Fe3+-hydroxamate transport system substrate-binding protein